MTVTNPKRRWFRFSIRELLLVTVIAAVTAGWWFDHQKLARENSIPLRDYSVVNVNAKDAAAYMAGISGGNVDVRIRSDSQQRQIVVQSPRQQQLEIQAILSKLDVPIAVQ